MSRFSFQGNSLLWRMLFSTSLALTVAFVFTGWIVETRAAAISEASLEREMRTSLQAYEALWRSRVYNMAEISRVMSTMSDVRAAFLTQDQATIRDTAAQLWSQVSGQYASFFVLDPTGGLIASLGGPPGFTVNPALIRAARAKFPDQVAGYATRESHLYYVVLTPVYVQGQNGPELLNVMLIAFHIDSGLAYELKKSTNGSDFVFISSNRVVASTLPGITPADLHAGERLHGTVEQIARPRADYLLLGTDLEDTTGRRIGRLYVIRSTAPLQATVADLRRVIALFWIAGLLVAVVLTYALFQRVLRPVQTLDRAAAEVIRRNYDYRVPVETHDELGRLAVTFNQMCDSISSAREDLIRQEQISTISRLSSSIVHDLRNPLAAIYGGAEMLVDAELSPEQRKRLAASIYNASRRIQDMLQELLDVSRSKSIALETCSLAEMVVSARDQVAQRAALQSVGITISVPESIEVIVSRGRLERVFVNLLDNAIDAMQTGGSVHISARVESGQAVVLVEDTGPGISEEAWQNLFRPFASYGKKSGLGLGLALSRQALLDNGGDLWVEKRQSAGARFLMRLPIAPGSAMLPHKAGVSPLTKIEN